MRRLIAIVATIFGGVLAAACAQEDPPTPAVTDGEDENVATTTGAVGPPWGDCSPQYSLSTVSSGAVLVSLGGVITTSVPQWTALCNADEACQAAVTGAAAFLAQAEGQMVRATSLHSQIQVIMSDWAVAANLLNLGAAPNAVVAGMFVFPLGRDVVRVSMKTAGIDYATGAAEGFIGQALSATAAFPEVEEPVRQTLTPIAAAIATWAGGPSFNHFFCVETSLAEMAAIAAQQVAAGPGPGGGFNPPPLPPGPPPPPAPPPGGGVPPPPPSDPFAPIVGPTNPWVGMPDVTVDFSQAPYDDPVYAMKRCEGPSDTCGPIETNPQCPAAVTGGYDCGQWASYRQVWFTYSLPPGNFTTPEIESVVDESCPERPEGDFCNSGVPGQPGNCRGGKCVTVPAGSPVCAGAHGYGPVHAEIEARYMCSAIECPANTCLSIATQNAAFQYSLAPFPANVTCNRWGPGGPADGPLYPGDTIGCRVNLRTDGPPEAVGQLRSQQFKVIHVDVAGAHTGEPTLRIEQTFNVIWKSEVPPGTCYSWDSYAKKWDYTPSICAGCDGIPESGLEFDECGVCGGDGSTC